MKRVIRYNRFSLQTSCRICLTQTMASKVSLRSPLRGEETAGPLVFEALQVVTNDKVSLETKLPDTVCGMCVELLKISYDLVLQYQKSKRKLKNHFRNNEDDRDDDSSIDYLMNTTHCSDEDEQPVKQDANLETSPASKASVEIFIGKEKFNIQDILIVEDDSDNSETFEGFLNNLGSSISAFFVKRGYEKRKLNVEEPSLVIEKVVPGTPEDSGSIQVTNADVQNFLLANFQDNNDDFLDGDHTEPEDFFLSTPINIDLVKRDIDDKDVLESALKLKYQCPYCRKPMASLTRAKMHSKRCGLNTSNIRCYLCSAKFLYRKQLLKHIKENHLKDVENSIVEDNVDNELEKLVCRICNQFFTSKGSFSYHMKKHSGVTFPCDKCDKQCYTRSQLKGHLQSHMKDTTMVVCPICGKRFHYKGGLYYHMKMHTNERNLHCQYCPRKFYTRNSLKRHELTHTGARPYACQYCDKKFRSLGEVKKHELLHTGERPYKCQYCDMGFTQTHNLRVHWMTHSGDYRCKECLKGFADADILRFHMKHRHQIKESDLLESPVEEQEEEDRYEVAEDEDFVQENEDDETLTATKQIDMDDQEMYYISEAYIADGDDVETQDLVVEDFELSSDNVLVETAEDFE